MCDAVTPSLSMVLVSLPYSMVVEGTIFVRGNRGVLPLSTCRRVLFHPPSPQRTPSVESLPADSWEIGEVIGDGSSAPAVRGNRHFQEGCQGVRAYPRSWKSGHVHDGEHVGVDDQPDPRVA